MSTLPKFRASMIWDYPGCFPRKNIHEPVQVIGSLKEIFPEVSDAEKRVVEVLADEETTFNRTLDKGLKEFNKVAGGLGDNK